MMFKNERHKNNWCLFFGIILAGAVQYPFATKADSEVKFHGTLMAASCTPDAIDVEFGEISLDNIPAARQSVVQGESVRSTGTSVKPFNLTLNCSGDIKGIEYKWSGAAASFSNKYLETDIPGLAIQIGDGDTATVIEPDVWNQLDSSIRTKNMLAILLRDPNAIFTGGEFNATATFSIQVP